MIMAKDIALIINEDTQYPDSYSEHELSDIEQIDNNSCDNIFIGDLLDYIPPKDFEDTLNSIVDKTKTDGLIHIQAPDIFQVCWFGARMNLSMDKLRYILYENQRGFCHTFDEMISLVNKIKNTKIDMASYTNGYEYSISIKKHEETD